MAGTFARRRGSVKWRLSWERRVPEDPPWSRPAPARPPSRSKAQARYPMPHPPAPPIIDSTT